MSVLIQDTPYTNIEYDGLHNTSEYGKPSVPVMYLRFSVPYNAVNFNLNNSETYNSYIIETESPILINSESPFNNSNDTIEISNNTTNTYPNSAFEIVNVGYYSGIHKIVTIALYPVTTLPLSDSYTFNQTIKINLSWNLTSNLLIENQQPVVSPKSMSDETIKAVKSIIENPEDVLSNSYNQIMPFTSDDSETYEYLIICPFKLLKPLEKLAQIKRLKGFSTKVIPISEAYYKCPNGDEISGINDNAGKLRAFLKYAYEVYDTKYVLLAGKYPDIPIRYAWTDALLNKSERNAPTDLYFAELNSSWNTINDGKYGQVFDYIDYFCELNIGRIPFENEDEVYSYINKLKIYEFNPGLGDPSYLSKAFMSRQNRTMMSENFFTDKQLSSFFNLYNDNLIDYTDNGIDFPNSIDVINKLNVEPCGMWNLIGHGNPGGVAIRTLPELEGSNYVGLLALDKDKWYHNPVYSAGIDNIKNFAFPSWSYSMSCCLMPFDTYIDKNNTPYNVDKNFGESYILGNNYGGVAFIGNTRASILPEAQRFMQDFFKIISDLKQDKEEAQITSGDLLSRLRSKNSLITLHHQLIIHNLLGDPTTNLWYDKPESLSYTEIENISNNKEEGIERGHIKYHLSSDEKLIMANMSLYNSTFASHGVLCQRKGDTLRVSDNCITTIYGKNTIPLTLPLTVKNFSFQNYGYDYSFIANDINFGRYKDTDDKAWGPNNLVLENDVSVSIESHGNINFFKPTLLRKGSSLHIIADGDVYIEYIEIEEGATCHIEANTIYIEDGTVTLHENSNFECIERNSQNNRIRKKIKEETYTPMVVEGRTWWYYDKYNIMNFSAESGFRIGEKVMIDGVEWHKVEKILSRGATNINLNEMTFTLGYDAEPMLTAYIREEDRKVYVRMDDKCLPFSDFDCCASPLWYDYNNEALIYDFGKHEDEFGFGTAACVCNFRIMSCDNSDKGVGKIYKAIPLSGNLQMLVPEEYQYCEKFGVLDHPSTFWFPLTAPCASIPGYEAPILRYVTEGDGNEIIYTGAAGTKLWEEYASAEPIVSDPAASGTHWFNLQGLEIPQPRQPGIYLRKTAGEVEKVIVR